MINRSFRRLSAAGIFAVGMLLAVDAGAVVTVDMDSESFEFIDANDVRIDSAGALHVGDVALAYEGGSVSVSATGTVASSGPVSFDGDLRIEGASVSLTSVVANQLTILTVGNVSIDSFSGNRVDVSTEGAIFITELNVISGVDVAAGASIQIASLSSNGAVSIASDGDVELDATTATGDIVLNVGGGLMLGSANTANGDILLAATNDISIDGQVLALNASGGSSDIKIESTSGVIDVAGTLSAEGENSVVAIQTTAGAIDITKEADAGALRVDVVGLGDITLKADTATNDSDVSLSGGGITLSAGVLQGITGTPSAGGDFILASGNADVTIQDSLGGSVLLSSGRSDDSGNNRDEVIVTVNAAKIEATGAIEVTAVDQDVDLGAVSVSAGTSVVVSEKIDLTDAITVTAVEIVDHTFEAVERWETGWVASEWFGIIYDKPFPWIYHSLQGWIWMGDQTDPKNLWLYYQNLGWSWTTDSLYPFIYRSRDSAWLWFDESNESQRWYYNLRTSEWELIQ